jgi:hypothetical protein
VDDDVDRDACVGELDGANDRLGVVHVDVASEGQAEEGEGLLSVDEGAPECVCVGSTTLPPSPRRSPTTG